MSACVTVWVATQTTNAPGATVAPFAGVHVTSTAPTPGSVTVTPVSVTLPVFATVIAYEITAPTASYGPAEVTVFVTFSAGAWIPGTDAWSVSLTFCPEGWVAVTVARLSTAPASSSG